MKYLKIIRKNFLFPKGKSNVPPINNVNSQVYNSEMVIPVSIFNNDFLSSLETITKYLKENIGLSYISISQLLNRDQRTIWNAYSFSNKKMSLRFDNLNSQYFVPLSIFQDRSLSTLESLTEYLKDNHNLRYCQIASLLNRNQRTVWTVYQRARKKRRVHANA